MHATFFSRVPELIICRQPEAAACLGDSEVVAAHRKAQQVPDAFAVDLGSGGADCQAAFLAVGGGGGEQLGGGAWHDTLVIGAENVADQRVRLAAAGLQQQRRLSEHCGGWRVERRLSAARLTVGEYGSRAALEGRRHDGSHGVEDLLLRGGPGEDAVEFEQQAASLPGAGKAQALGGGGGYAARSPIRHRLQADQHPAPAAGIGWKRPIGGLSKGGGSVQGARLMRFRSSWGCGSSLSSLAIPGSSSMHG